jgi:putative mRNA 3-end processing factor
MELRFLGGAGEVGRSAILVNDSLLLDYGMLTGNPPQFPIDDPDPEAVVVSHGHLDHVGAVPALLSGDARPAIHWTPPTYRLTLLLARDTLRLQGGRYDCPFTEEEIKRVTQVSRTHGYRESFEAAGHTVTFFDAGHIPGSAHVLVDDGETRLLYTADFHAGDDRVGDDSTSRTDRSGGPIRGQRLVAPSTARPEADVVLTESTYADTDHGDRGETEAAFADSLRTTVWEGGTVVVPAFAIGRTQEAMLICERYDLDCYVDGMGTQVLDILKRHSGYVRDATALKRATSNARFVDGRDGQRERIAKSNTVIITTSGMLSGGPAMTYVPEIRTDPVNKIAMTGYQVAGTPGRELFETGRAEINGQVMPVAAQVEQYDFSAHADSGGIRSFLSAYANTPILVNHGDDCAGFAAELEAEGMTASAPDLGGTVEV